MLPTLAWSTPFFRLLLHVSNGVGFRLHPRSCQEVGTQDRDVWVDPGLTHSPLVFEVS